MPFSHLDNTEYGMFSFPTGGGQRSMYQELVSVNRTLQQKVEELKRAQTRLIEYRKAVECTGDMIFVFDRDYRYLMANRAYLEARGSVFPDVVGKTLPEVIGSATFERIRAQLEVCLAGGEVSYEDTYHYPDKGLRSILVTMSPIRDDAGRVDRAACLIKDITENKLLEEQLRQSQKMEAIGTLAGGIAHDFNNILTVIAGYASLIQLNGAGSEAASMAREIMISAERAAEMTRSLLAFSRKQEVHLDAMDVNLVVGDLHKSLSRLITEEIELVVRLCEAPLCICADRRQVEQVLINLAVNARDAMPGGGVLSITTATVELRDEDLPPGSYAAIVVADNGTGMDKEVQARVFEPFFTTKEVGKGTGLGLSSSYGIIRKHNGLIRVNSEPGAGTSFSIYLPLCGAQTEQGTASAAFARSTGSETILLVEDDRTVRGMTQMLLEQHGYRVLVAREGEEALRVFEKESGTVRLLLTDVIMPRLNGRLLSEKVRQLAPGLPVIFMSGYPADVMSQSGLAGSGTYLPKPVKPDELLGTIRETLNGSSFPASA
ncbi:hybrid sensor histidine kinase/response regulator [Geomonas ferrireducens]|uniref:hybrid sensor histidine kinase/response regulator n=1 Tax=Geomonas ferrireducens TaxID=2570227 RepID=UPI0010A794A3|nr:PAS domain-containing sensor histidine kinase [Geomonas ferrireducens]